MLLCVKEGHGAVGGMRPVGVCPVAVVPIHPFQPHPVLLAKKHLEVTGGIFRVQPLLSSIATFDIWTYLVTSSFGQKRVFLVHCMVWPLGKALPSP